MIDVHLCGYCVALPENDRAHAARVMRCPLCKTELGFTASGDHFRLRSGAAAPALPWRSPVLWAGLSVGMIATASLIALAMYLLPTRV